MDDDAPPTRDQSQVSAIGPILEYRSALAQEHPLSKLQVLAGMVVSALITFIAVFAGVLIAISGEKPFVAWITIGSAVLGINLCAALVHRNRVRRGLAMGLWFGFALAVLIEGICFLNFR